MFCAIKPESGEIIVAYRNSIEQYREEYRRFTSGSMTGDAGFGMVQT